MPSFGRCAAANGMVDEADLPAYPRQSAQGAVVKPWLGTGERPKELQTFWAHFWSVIAVILAVILLVAYGAVMRSIRVSQSLDRLERSVGSLSMGQGEGGVSRVAEEACLEVARSRSEVAPLAWMIRSVVEPSWSWLEPAVQSVWADGAAQVTGWMQVPAMAEAADRLCEGVRYAVRGAVTDRLGTDRGAAAADLAMAEGRFENALTVLAMIDPAVVERAPLLARGASHVRSVKGLVAERGLTAPVLARLPDIGVRLGVLSLDGTGRPVTIVIVLTVAQSADRSAPVVVIARVTVEKGMVVSREIREASAWSREGARRRPAPAGMTTAGGGILPAGSPWPLESFDWWIDFRSSALQFLELWSDAGQDAALVDGLVALDARDLSPTDGQSGDAPAVGVARLLDRIGLLDGAAIDIGANDGPGHGLGVLAEAARRGTLVAWFRDPELAMWVRSQGWDGGLVQVPGSSIRVVTADASEARGKQVTVAPAGQVTGGIRVDVPGTVRGHVRVVLPPGIVPGGTDRMSVTGAVSAPERVREGQVDVVGFMASPDGSVPGANVPVVIGW